MQDVKDMVLVLPVAGGLSSKMQTVGVKCKVSSSLWSVREPDKNDPLPPW